MSGEMSTNLPTKYEKLLSGIIPEDHDDDDCKITKVSVIVPEDLVKAPMASNYEMVTVSFNRPGLAPVELFTKKRLPKGTCPVLNAQWTAVMRNEGIFLKEFMDKMKNSCRQYSADCSEDLIADMFPRTYYCDDEMVIMENLVKRGYSALANRDDQSFEDAQLVLKHLARLHALTHVMIERAGGALEFLSQYPNFGCALLNPKLMNYFSRAFESALASSLEVLKKSDHPDREETHEILQKWQGNLDKRLIDVITSSNALTCVCHGNLCGDNIMFDTSGLVSEKLVLVDFQMARTGSPTSDIGYYLFRSVNQQARRRWKELLKMYFEMLENNVNFLGHDLELTFQDLVRDFAQQSEMGFLFGIFFAKGNDPSSIDDVSGRIVGLVNDYLEIQKACNHK